MDKFIFMVMGGLGSVSALTFGLVMLSNRLNETRNDLNRGLAKKADLSACLKQHEHDERLHKKMEDISNMISKISQSLARVETRLNYSRSNDDAA